MGSLQLVFPWLGTFFLLLLCGYIALEGPIIGRRSCRSSTLTLGDGRSRQQKPSVPIQHCLLLPDQTNRENKNKNKKTSKLAARSVPRKVLSLVKFPNSARSPCRQHLPLSTTPHPHWTEGLIVLHVWRLTRSSTKTHQSRGLSLESFMVLLKKTTPRSDMKVLDTAIVPFYVARFCSHPAYWTSKIRSPSFSNHQVYQSLHQVLITSKAKTKTLISSPFQIENSF